MLSVNREAITNCLPDKVLYLDMDVQTALSRTFDSAGDKWEKMGKDFFEKIVRGYHKCADLEMLAGRFMIING